MHLNEFLPETKEDYPGTTKPKVPEEGLVIDISDTATHLPEVSLMILDFPIRFPKLHATQ